MTTLFKLGIAVACLVGVTGLIAMDLMTERKEAGPSTTSVPTTVERVVPPAVPLPVQHAAVRAVEPASRPQIPSGATSAGAQEAGEKKGAVAPKGETPDGTVGEKAQKAGSAPVAPPQVKNTPLETLPGGQRVYTVVQGDTLYGISVKVFGTPRHYERIYEANKDKIEDPNTLQIGMKLTMPDVPSKPGAGSAGTTGTAPAPTRAESAPQPADAGPKDLR
jgi:phage tail protein X